jgi:hypothetical protein
MVSFVYQMVVCALLLILKTYMLLNHKRNPGIFLNNLKHNLFWEKSTTSKIIWYNMLEARTDSDSHVLLWSINQQEKGTQDAH